MRAIPPPSPYTPGTGHMPGYPSYSGYPATGYGAPAQPAQPSAAAFIKRIIPAPPAAAAVFLGLGRAVNKQGGHHSIGDALLWGGIAAGVSIIGVLTARSKHSHPLVTVGCLLVAGGSMQLAVSGYATGWAVPAAVSALFTLAGYCTLPLVVRWRTRLAEKSAARHHEQQLKAMEIGGNTHIAAIEAEGAAYRAELADRHASSMERYAEGAYRHAAASLPASPGVALNDMAPQAQAFVLLQMAKRAGLLDTRAPVRDQAEAVLQLALDQGVTAGPALLAIGARRGRV